MVVGACGLGSFWLGSRLDLEAQPGLSELAALPRRAPALSRTGLTPGVPERIQGSMNLAGVPLHFTSLQLTLSILFPYECRQQAVTVAVPVACSVETTGHCF